MDYGNGYIEDEMDLSNHRGKIERSNSTIRFEDIQFMNLNL